MVDGCYSYWQVATFFTLEYELSAELKQAIRGLFDEEALQRYVLVICQDRKNGGLRDKPEKFVLVVVLLTRILFDFLCVFNFSDNHSHNQRNRPLLIIVF